MRRWASESRALESNLKIAHYLALCVSYKGTAGPGQVFACLLRFCVESLKDNCGTGMFIMASDEARSLFLLDRLVT